MSFDGTPPQNAAFKIITLPENTGTRDPTQNFRDPVLLYPSLSGCVLFALLSRSRSTGSLHANFVFPCMSVQNEDVALQQEMVERIKTRQVSADAICMPC